MKLTSSVIILLLIIHVATGQTNIRKYISDHAARIDHVDFETPGDSDLTAIGNAIGDRRIVMLGELSHGDGSSFQAKARIVRYLHEKKGFNVLAFESDFFALNEGWDKVKAGALSPDTLLHLAVFPVWTYCKACEPLFKYIIRESGSATPLTITGFDSQLVSGYSMMHFTKKLKTILDTTGIPFIQLPLYDRYIALTRRITLLKGDSTVPRWDSLVNCSVSVLQQLREKYSDTTWCVRVVKNVLSFSTQMRYYWSSHQEYSGSYAIRDTAMADNLSWLVTHRYPQEKIIVWAHNGHIYKNEDPQLNKKSNTLFSAGYHFTRDPRMKKSTYIMGFTAYSGKSMFVTSRHVSQVSKPLHNSVENWLEKKGFPYAFVDLLPFNTIYPDDREKYYMKTDVASNGFSYWHNIYDGIFFIGEMLPCEASKGILGIK